MASDRLEETALLNAVAGVASAIGGTLLPVGDGSHNVLLHAPHQLLLAVPAGLLATILLRPDEPRTFWIGAGAATLGLLAGEVLVVAALGATHA